MAMLSGEALSRIRSVASGAKILLVAWLLISPVGCGGDRDKLTVDAQPDDEPVASAPSISTTPDNATGTEVVELDRGQTIQAIETLLMQGDLPGAESKLKSLLVQDPTDAEIIFRLATVVAGRDDLSQAIELLDSIPVDHPDAGLPALGQSADWCFALERWDDAERRYRQILDAVPDASQAHRNLAYLYNRQGRRHEAASHIYQLCRRGDVRQDELHALIQLSDAMYTPRDQPISHPNDRPYWPIGPAAEARRLFMEHRYQEAVEVLRPSVTAGNQPASILAFYGRAATEAQDESTIKWWLTQVDDQSQDHADYWAALGLLLVTQNRLEEAGRALVEALVRDPTDFRSISRLRSVMESLGFADEAVRLEGRFQTLEAIARVNNRIADAANPDVEAMGEIATLLDSVDRGLEASVWRLMAGVYQQLPQTELGKLRATFAEVVNSGDGQTKIESRICGIDREKFSLPDIDSLRTPEDDKPYQPKTPSTEQIAAQFENVADAVGLHHTYEVASETQERGFSVYQSVGGAVAVLDFDNDGRADLYFAQGNGDPPSFVGDKSNLLFRCFDKRTMDVTANAYAEERRYSLGVTAGDWNQDGFADIAIANIGSNTLLINNGDGTFRRESLDDGNDKTLMTTSLAMADLTGDHLPDLYEVNYVHDTQISKRPRRNAEGDVVETLKPKFFQPGLDRLFVHDAQGGVAPQPMGEREPAARAGLGVVVGDFDHESGNEVFVGNDVYANQLWRRDANTGDWLDVAMLVGNAYGFSGAKTASMGIAAGDFDRNGWLDFHITNFQGESVSHYLNDHGMYQDRNIQFGFSDPSQSVLGFGTQAVDYDNDGDLDLIVANGHIEDAVNSSAPFKQPMQLFRNDRDRFELAEVVDTSGYWSGRHLGRGLARMDWNRDGLPDVVVTHLGEPSALLLNQSPDSNHWMQLVLRGVVSERDAVGARVELRAGARVLTEWVTAGDGFFSRNEPVLMFGLETAESVDRVTIHWPSGTTQTFTDLESNHRWLVIENESEPFALAP